MANYTTSADLLDDALDRAGEPIDGTSDFNTAAIRYLNRGYQAIWKGGGELVPEVDEVWWWLRKDGQGVLTLLPVLSTGTVSVTNISASITFSTGPTASQVGRHFKVTDHADIFVVTAHTAGETGATLESVYTGTTDGTAAFKSILFDYTLASDVLYVTGPMCAYQDGERQIEGVDLEKLKRRWPLNNLFTGVPHQFSMIGQQKVRFSHGGGTESTDLMKVDYEYMYEPSDLADDSTEPLIPREYRKTLADYVLAFLLFDKHDTRAGEAMKLAQNGVVSMAKEHRRRMNRFGGEVFAQIITRPADFTRWQGPIRTEAGLIIG